MKTPHLVPELDLVQKLPLVQELHLVPNLPLASQKEIERPIPLGGLAGWLIEFCRRWREVHLGVRPAAQMHLVETLPLGGKRQLMLVTCAGERFLVAAGQECVQSIVQVTQSTVPVAFNHPSRTDTPEAGERS